MKIAIIGPGALGGLLGALLFEAGEEVTLVDYLPERAARLKRQGLRLRTPARGERQIPVPIGLPGEAGPANLVIVAVKAHQTQAAALSLRPLLAEQGLVLSLQNGLGNLETLAAAVGPQRLLAGVAMLGVARTAAGRLFWPVRGRSRPLESPAALRFPRENWPGWRRRCAGPAWTAASNRSSRWLCGKSCWSTSASIP